MQGRRVSLGLFTERARAERRAESVRAMGLKAEVAERKLANALYWVDLAPQPGMNTIPLQDLFCPGGEHEGLGAAVPAGRRGGSGDSCYAGTGAGDGRQHPLSRGQRAAPAALTPRARKPHQPRSTLPRSGGSDAASSPRP